jgi:hypothetical protein
MKSAFFLTTLSCFAASLPALDVPVSPFERGVVDRWAMLGPFPYSADADANPVAALGAPGKAAIGLDSAITLPSGKVLKAELARHRGDGYVELLRFDGATGFAAAAIHSV